MLPAIYTFTCCKKYTRADIGETLDFLRLLLLLNLGKQLGCTLIRACMLNRSDAVHVCLTLSI